MKFQLSIASKVSMEKRYFSPSIFDPPKTDHKMAVTKVSEFGNIKIIFVKFSPPSILLFFSLAEKNQPQIWRW